MDNVSISIEMFNEKQNQKILYRTIHSKWTSENIRSKNKNINSDYCIVWVALKFAQNYHINFTIKAHPSIKIGKVFPY